MFLPSRDRSPGPSYARNEPACADAGRAGASHSNPACCAETFGHAPAVSLPILSGTVPSCASGHGGSAESAPDCLSHSGVLEAPDALDYMRKVFVQRLKLWLGCRLVCLLGLAASWACGGKVTWAEEGADGSAAGDSVDQAGAGGGDANDSDLQAARLACQVAIQSGVVQPTTDQVWIQEICSLCPEAIMECANDELHWCVPMCQKDTAAWGCECTAGAHCVDQVRLAHGFLALCVPRAIEETPCPVSQQFCENYETRQGCVCNLNAPKQPSDCGENNFSCLHGNMGCGCGR